MVWLGCALAAAAALYLAAGFFRTTRRRSYPAYGLIGLAAIALAEALLAFDVWPITLYFTPIVWTGYILAVDAAVFSLRGRSLLRSEPDAMVWMAVLSIFLWLIFEAYNLRLANWTYVGQPPNLYARYLGYGWAFATIWPALLETAELLLATRFPFPEPAARRPPFERRLFRWMALGLALSVAPLVVPLDTAPYMFGAVWTGFVLLVDPWNWRASRASIAADLRAGNRARLKALLASGVICGFFWEFWNYWAAAKWLYIFPIFQDWKLFEMPVPGFLGFPLLALEAFALYAWATATLKLPFYEIR